MSVCLSIGRSVYLPLRICKTGRARKPLETKGFQALISLPAGPAIRPAAFSSPAIVSCVQASGRRKASQPDREGFTEAVCQSTVVENSPG